MFTISAFPTPNNYKALLMLEECQAPYRIRFTDLITGQHKNPGFMARCRPGKLPFMEEADTQVSLYGSTSILYYLADRYGRMLPADAGLRAKAVERFFFIVNEFGEAFNRMLVFTNVLKTRDEFALGVFNADIDGYARVLEGWLETEPYLAGADYGIADIAAYPFLGENMLKADFLARFPRLQDWTQRVSQRIAVRKVYKDFAPLF